MGLEYPIHACRQADRQTDGYRLSVGIIPTPECHCTQIFDSPHWKICYAKGPRWDHDMLFTWLNLGLEPSARAYSIMPCLKTAFLTRSASGQNKTFLVRISLLNSDSCILESYWLNVFRETHYTLKPQESGTPEVYDHQVLAIGWKVSCFFCQNASIKWRSRFASVLIRLE